MGEEIRINLRLDGDMAKRFSEIKENLGLKNDTEIVRSLINWYYHAHETELRPKLEHWNLNENGVSITDRQLNRIIQVWFKPDRIWCEYDESSDCKHVDFALDLPEVQEILRKKGWKPK